MTKQQILNALSKIEMELMIIPHHPTKKSRQEKAQQVQNMVNNLWNGISMTGDTK